MTAPLIDSLLAEAKAANSDQQRWSIICRAWVGYLDHGASYFDWDYESRDLMSALSGEEICGICGDPIDRAAVIDHKNPLGGSQTEANTQPVHPWCNSAKGTTK